MPEFNIIHLFTPIIVLKFKVLFLPIYPAQQFFEIGWSEKTQSCPVSFCI